MDVTTSLEEIAKAVVRASTPRTLDRAATTLELLDEMLHALGPLRRRDQELWAGERRLNGDTEILGRLARSSGLAICIYLGNRRIAAVGSGEGSTAQGAGGYAEAVLVDAVLRRGEGFQREIESEGRHLALAARPLFVSSATREQGPVGMLSAFREAESAFDWLQATLQPILMPVDDDATASRADGMEAVIHFIDDVARRLQLLALNGNIIAAQAGDHGRAFRVVCRELSALAEQSKDAVGEVRRLMDALGLAPKAMTEDAAGAALNLPE